jgi:peptide/nickel transport system substrate-binding protein
LLVTDKNGDIVPHVAKSWSSSDAGRVYNFKLNDGIKCHDGTALDANDIKYTIDKAFNSESPSLTKGSWGPITEVKIISPLEIQFTLEKPFVALISFLADSFSSIICDSNKNKSGFGTSVAIGSGPWKFKSWAKGDRITLEKKSNL